MSEMIYFECKESKDWIIWWGKLEDTVMKWVSYVRIRVEVMVMMEVSMKLGIELFMQLVMYSRKGGIVLEL
jgi:hypothetical protein